MCGGSVSKPRTQNEKTAIQRGGAAPKWPSVPLVCLLLGFEMSSKEDADGEWLVFLLLALTRDNREKEVLYHSEMNRHWRDG